MLYPRVHTGIYILYFLIHCEVWCVDSGLQTSTKGTFIYIYYTCVKMYRYRCSVHCTHTTYKYTCT